VAAVGRIRPQDRAKGVSISAPEYDGVCFHCQQAVEKYLKALLNERSQSIPRTHDLADLIDRLLPSDHVLRPLRTPVGRLTVYAVFFRYPGFRSNKRRTVTALATVERVRAEIRRLLGLQPRP